ncbi:MAG: hypothetical protein IPF92_07865 [Myxococcales bacterium]|jgi:hypothetical protein|nr:hypothetical protein [Myxococcales bacterium]
MRALACLYFAFLSLSAVAGCAVKDTAGNGESGLLEFSAPDEPLAVGVPAPVRVTRPNQGVHVCIKGCVDLDPNALAIDEVTCDDGACEVVSSRGGLGIIARREGAFTLRIKGRDGSTAIADSFTLTAKAPASLVVVSDVRPHDPAGTLGLAPGLLIQLGAEVRSSSGEKLAHDVDAEVFAATGAMARAPSETGGAASRRFEAKAPGSGEVTIAVGPLRGALPVVVANPESTHASLELYRYAEGRASSELQKGPIVLQRSSYSAVALVARDARGQAYFTGSRYVATKSEPLVSSFPVHATAPIFYLRTSDETPDAFVAAFGGQSVSLPVAVESTGK